MKNDYKRIFDNIRIPEERQREIRSKLASSYFESRKVENTMGKKINIKYKRVAIVAAAFIVSLGLVGFTFGNQIIKFFSGGYVEVGKDGNGYHLYSFHDNEGAEPMEIRQGQIYFVFDGKNINITDMCSDKTYYQYEAVDADGYRHVVLVGGNPDDVGWAEIIFNADGSARTVIADYDKDVEPMWLTTAKEKLGI